MARIEVENSEAVAKRALKLAWDNSKALGMGVLQDRGPGMTEDQVWKNAVQQGDYGDPEKLKTVLGVIPPHGTVRADYVFGRMMKLNFTFGDGFVEAGDSPYRPDYQSFCRKFPTFASLVHAAVGSLAADAARRPLAEKAV